MKSDMTFFLLLLGLGGVAWYLYTRKTTTVVAPPPSPSACDQLLGGAGSAVATSQGAPIKINAPTGLCMQLEKAGKLTYRSAGYLASDIYSEVTHPISTAKGVSSGTIQAYNELTGVDTQPLGGGSGICGTKGSDNSGWRTGAPACYDASGKVAAVGGGGNFRGKPV